MKRAWTWLMCLIGNHDWTSAAAEGVPVDVARHEREGLAYFYEYARGYCRHCNTTLNVR